MTTTRVVPPSLRSFSFSRQFKFPENRGAGRILHFKFRGKKNLHAVPATSICTNQTSNGGSFLSLHTRRGLTLLSTLPFLIPLHELLQGFAANATEEDDGEASAIQDGIRRVVSKAKAAGLLRLVFHDAGTYDMIENSGGMNGSIIFELNRPENAGLSKSVKILEKAKIELEKVQPVSWADMIAVAGAEAVSTCGGPVIPVQLGRLDSVVPDPEGKLPLESFDAPDLKKCFLRKGFSTQELVALSGAHTIGNKGFGSPTVFDNSYFRILSEKSWTSSAGMSNMVGLPSDRALIEDDECIRWITTYADDQKIFFEDFRRAYIKLVNAGAQWRKA